MKKVYVMENKQNGAIIECTEEYLTAWLARGFEVKCIKMDGSIIEDNFTAQGDGYIE